MTVHLDPELWGMPGHQRHRLLLSTQGQVRALAYGGKSQLKRERPEQFPGNQNVDEVKGEEGARRTGVRGGERRGRDLAETPPRPT